MIRTAICDDQPDTRTALAALVRAQPYPCDLVEYASAAECLADPQPPDLLFLDIGLGPAGPDGMALARRMRERGGAQQPVIIFVTGYDRYVFDAFDVGAFQYLLKPVDEQKFAEVFARAAALLEARRSPRALTLRFAHASKTVPVDAIRYIESSGHKVTLHLREGEFSCYAKLNELEAELQGSFFRIHKGYLVNLAYLSSYTRAEVTLTSGERLLLSKYKYRDFVKAYLRFLKAGAGL